MTFDEIMNAVIPAVSSQLKAPASAQFPLELVSIQGDDYYGYQLHGYVDSQNSYGAMIRNDFSATVSVQYGYPVVTSCSVGKEANAQNAASFGINYLLITLFTGIGGVVLYFLISALVG